MSADTRLDVLELVVKYGSENDRKDPLPKADQWYAWVTGDNAGDKEPDAPIEDHARLEPRRQRRRRRHGGQPETARDHNG